MFTLYLEKTYFEHAKFSSTREPNTCEKYYVQMFDRLSVMSHRLTYTYTFHMCMCVCVCECVFDCMRLTAERWRSSCSGHQYSTNNGRITKNIPFECRIKLLFDSSALCLATDTHSRQPCVIYGPLKVYVSMHVHVWASLLFHCIVAYAHCSYKRWESNHPARAEQKSE